MTKLAQNFAALTAACAIVLATWVPVVTVPAATTQSELAAPMAANSFASETAVITLPYIA